MATGGVSVEGVDRLVDTLDQAARDLQVLDQAHRQAGSLVAGVATRTSPRRSGALAATVQATVTGSLVAVTAGGGRVDYAAAVHARNPWMTRAAKATQDDVVRAYTEAAAQAVSQIKGT